MITRATSIGNLRGFMFLLSIVGALFVFQNFPSVVEQTRQPAKTEWVASGRARIYNSVPCSARRIGLSATYRFTERRYLHLVKTKLRIATDRHRSFKRFPIRKTISFSPEEEFSPLAG
jgi:hypothetical protein